MNTTQLEVGDIVRLKRPGHPWNLRLVRVTAAFGEGYIVTLRRARRHQQTEDRTPSISVAKEELCA